MAARKCELFLSFETEEFSQHNGCRAKAGEALLKQVCTDKNRKPHEVAADEVRECNTQ